MTPKDIKRFYSKVTIQPGCWKFDGYKRKDGYHNFSYNIEYKQHKTFLAHRCILEALGCDISGKVIMHICDNRGCVNPDHLRVGTQQDNIIDKCNKNRQIKGKDSYSAKLTDNDIEYIRQVGIIGTRGGVPNGNTQILSEKFNISISHIRSIINKRHWKHI